MVVVNVVAGGQAIEFGGRSGLSDDEFVVAGLLDGVENPALRPERVILVVAICPEKLVEVLSARLGTVFRESVFAQERMDSLALFERVVENHDGSVETDMAISRSCCISTSCRIRQEA